MVRKSKRKARKTSNDDFPEFDLPSLEIPRIDIPIPNYNLSGTEERRVDPNKLSKPELVSILSSSLSVDEIYRYLIRLGKQKLAEEFLSEVEYVNKKYKEIISQKEGKTEQDNIEKKILENVLNEIIIQFKKIYSLSFKPQDEIDFHKQIEPFLYGVASMLETSLTKFGWKINISREYVFPSNERIDLLITLGELKIGIEVKYDLEETSKLQRLLGQIDRYTPYLDALIVVSYLPIKSAIINYIKGKEVEKGKPIKIVTPDKIL